MSFIDNGGGSNMTMPVQPMGYGGYGGGNGNGFWGDGSFWIIILFLFAMMGNGNWGFGGGNYGGGMPGMINTVNNDVQRGFDQQSVMNGINGISSSMANGFANAEVSRCNSQANVLSAINTGTANTIAAINTNGNSQMASMNNLAMSLQNCCCENRAGLADLKYTVATEACSDRQTVSDGIRDLLAAGTANTQALINSTNAGMQNIMDKICQMELDGKNQQIQNLQTQLNMATLRESQTAQTAAILANNAAQTQALEQYLNPAPIPAYMVQNPNCCANQVYSGCGCGVA